MCVEMVLLFPIKFEDFCALYFFILFPGANAECF